MKSSLEIGQKINELKPMLSQKYFVDKIGYFGSFSRYEQRKDSDIDILASDKALKAQLNQAFVSLQKLWYSEFEIAQINDETIRKEVVNIIEAVAEPFNNRKRIYELWTH